MTVEFAVLPFVKVDGPLSVGTFVLWPNTDAEWRARFDITPPKLLELYRDRSGRSSGSSLSILSPSPAEEVSFGQYQDAVVVLSTADWLRGDSGTASDAWVFEPWRIEPTDDDHVRSGKFSLNLTDAANDRHYPDPYTHPVRINRWTYEDGLKRLAPLLTSEDEGARNRLTALWHLYLARRGSPYFASIFEDLEALWSAFEAWYRLPRTPAYKDQSRVARVIRAWVPRSVARRLHKTVWDRPSRSDLVFDGLSHDLASILDARVRAELRTLVDELYSLRSEQTHGGTPAPERLRREQQDAHIFGIALAVWRILIDYSYFGDSPFVEEELRGKLRDVFLERELHDRLLTAFSKTKREHWCRDDGTPSDRAHVEAQRDFFHEVLDVTVIPRRYRRAAAPRDACRQALLVISTWSKSAEARGIVFPGSAKQGFHNEFTAVVQSKPPDVDAKLLEMILRRKLHDRASFDDGLIEQIGDLGGIDFPTWVRITFRLRELFVGHELL